MHQSNCFLVVPDGNSDDMFYVHPSDGHLYVVGEPDAEVRTSYDLTVQVSNGKKSKTAHVSRESKITKKKTNKQIN